jgi:PAS domain S-box-containing protein
VASLAFLGLGSEAILHEMADALPDALFTTDAGGVVTFWNRAAEQITGWSRGEAVGRRCSLLAGDASSGCGCSCGEGRVRCGMIARGKTSKCCTIRAKDGRAILIVKSAVPLHAADGRPIGTLETFADVGSAERVERRPAPPRRDPDAADLCGMAGRTPAMRELYRMIELVARSDSTVMLLGESGTGKELAAEAIHRLSPRASGPFVRVSCSALNENLLESELFGHVRGAFTGALKDRRGRFEEAHGGTLLLDEIGDVSPVVQLKLLRVVEQREIERVGDSRPVRIDVRLVCATHRDLRALVADGRFRADLYFRLAVFPLRLPPLRERVDDVPLLAECFLARLRSSASRGRRLTPGAVQALVAHSWPGNVRELQNALEYAALRAGADDIAPEHLPELSPRASGPSRGTLSMQQGPAEPVRDERREIVEALERAGWNRARAAATLGVSRVTLWKRMKRHAIAGPATGSGGA